MLPLAVLIAHLHADDLRLNALYAQQTAAMRRHDLPAEEVLAAKIDRLTWKVLEERQELIRRKYG